LIYFYPKYIFDLLPLLFTSSGGIHSHVHNPSIGSGGSKSSTEPNIDFELDVKVFIDSGKCVLHPKDYKEDEQKR
jgi:protein associated with RNAse G/E